MNINKKFIIFLGFAFLLLITFSIFIFIKSPSFTVILLDSKPLLSGTFIRNPDISYNGTFLLSKDPSMPPFIQVLNDSNNWKGKGLVGFSDIPLGGRFGIALIHPVDTEMGRYIEQETYLPPGRYKLLIGIANAADMFSPELTSQGIGGFAGNCADVGLKVIITDLENKKDYEIFSKVIRNGRWYDYSIDLSSKFSDKKIKIRAESYAADGGCGIWNGEWATIDYVDIQPY
jgi:hypothetical protein